MIPVGAPQTGQGGAARSAGDGLIALGAMALAAAAVTFAVAFRRRQLDLRTLPTGGRE